MNSAKPLSFAAALLLLASSAFAQAPAHPCAATEDPEARLACYDEAFPPVASATDLDQQRREQARRDFGLSTVQKREMASEEAGDGTPERIEAAIASVSQRANGQRLVTLENEQIWLVTETTDKGMLKPGDKVVVRRGVIGNYLMRTPGRVTLRVRRVL
ncbi:MAG TPA: hypothetical protein VFQ84_12720 [Arenimonas sp.]|uniref:hypothetical protein n=1 Tax=Arenimonas sp. TaxID=1872635 RepID=UPI002D7E92C1|nr:hypothetical protein [Arenimonas sp.]HEU0154196.1 hypothetical protein [Arenimonas sp.]